MLLEEELSYKVRGCFYGVANMYGKGLKEVVYEKALAESFKKVGLKFLEQHRINIYSLETGIKLGTYVPDFIVEGKVVVEIKASSFTRKEDLNQQLSYLRCSIYEIGYLVNFSTAKLDIRRSIFTNDRKPFIAKLQKQNP